MRYNREFERLKFSTDQNIDSMTCDSLMREHEEFSLSMLTADIKNLNSMMNGDNSDTNDDSPIKKVFGIILGLIFVGGMLTSIAFVIMKDLVMFGFIFTGLFLLAGILLLLGQGSMPFNTANAGIKSKITGLYLVCATSAILSLLIIRDRFLDAELFVWIMSVAFGMSGLWLMATALTDKFSGRLVYREEVSARCKGYVRFVNYESSSAESIRTGYIYTSPVFEYFYGGVKYESLYDSFILGPEADIPYETVTTIRIDPKKPYNVLSPVTESTGGFIGMLIMAAMFIAVGSGLSWYMMSGGVNDSEVEVEWNSLIDQLNPDEQAHVEPSVPQLTDEWIENTYASSIVGKEWYYESLPIEHIKQDEDGTVLYFEDVGVYAFRIEQNENLKQGDIMDIFYTLSEDADYGYKQIFTYAAPGEIQYNGSHGAYTGDRQ